MTNKTGTANSAPRPEPRSYLYVPGDAERKLERVLERGADAIIIDLEDGVAPQAKDRARRSAQEWLKNLPAAAERDVDVLVRINHWPAGEADLEVAVCPAVNGICLPKAATSDLVELNAALERAEAAAGLSRGSLSVQPLVESARAVLEAPAMAAGPRVERLQLGELDLAADLGAEPGPDGLELHFARSQVVLASAAAAIGAPVGPVQADLHDTERFVRTTAVLRRMGFGSRACVHPTQVELANKLFTPAPAELDKAESVLAAYEAAVKAGSGAVAGPQGQLVDEATVRLARRLIARARAR
jgi:citrate lyase subunit beta/citryl-CoA lyase